MTTKARDVASCVWCVLEGPGHLLREGRATHGAVPALESSEGAAGPCKLHIWMEAGFSTSYLFRKMLSGLGLCKGPLSLNILARLTFLHSLGFRSLQRGGEWGGKVEALRPCPEDSLTKLLGSSSFL